MYGSLVLRCSVGGVTAVCDRAVAHWNCRSRTRIKPRRLDLVLPNLMHHWMPSSCHASDSRSSLVHVPPELRNAAWR